jgi:dienelactone hydrolase
MRHVLALGTLFLAVACGGSKGTPTAPPVTSGGSCTATPGVGLAVRSGNGLTLTTVLPRSTDTCITQAIDSHFVVRAPAVTPVGRLLVFLPGTGGVPQNYQLILAQAALAGYHAIGLSYPNAQAVSVLCAAQAVSCYGATRLEILTGESASNVVDVARSNSIENRLVKLLSFMQTTEPAGNWRQFLNTDGTMAWSQVAVSGHSQGGGHALFIAQRYAVVRGSTYASPGDLLPGSAGPAPWVTQPYATPTSRLAGFISTADELVAPAPTLAAWASIGLAGTAVNVDVTPAPYGTSQRFVTSAAAANPLLVIGPNHNVVVVDVNTPKTGPLNTPVFAAVWRAVSFP